LEAKSSELRADRECLRGAAADHAKKRCHRIVAHRIEARRLKPESPTRRMVAGCCDTPMFLDFTKAHWLTIFLQGRA